MFSGQAFSCQEGTWSCSSCFYKHCKFCKPRRNFFFIYRSHAFFFVAFIVLLPSVVRHESWVQQVLIKDSCSLALWKVWLTFSYLFNLTVRIDKLISVFTHCILTANQFYLQRNLMNFMNLHLMTIIGSCQIELEVVFMVVYVTCIWSLICFTFFLFMEQLFFIHSLYLISLNIGTE